MAKKEKTNVSTEDMAIFRKVINMLIPDVLKKSVLLGISGDFFSEETIRKMLSDIQMPSDLVQYVIQQTSKSKNELIRIIAEEIRNIIIQSQLGEEFKKFLKAFKINIKLEVSFDPRDDEQMLQLSTKIENKKNSSHGWKLDSKVETSSK
ncbi:MAG: hypothetical protein HQK75_18510 [Candidatus Magnetomorum sp.]|nr:hypothetical protein [Candidatus Magnetomorum sp.]